MLFDTHVHLDFLTPAVSLADELAAAQQQGVGAFLVPGVYPADWPRLVCLAEQEPSVWIAPGVHPQAAESWNDQIAAQLETLLRHPKVVAVGEVGLDGLLDSPSRLMQERVFREQAQLAVAAGKPLLIHCRRLFEPTLKILREERLAQVGGIFHAFSGSVEFAQAAVRQNFAIGQGGILTFGNARRAPQVASELDPQWLVLETDAPDLAPEPHRSEANRPCYLSLIAAKLAELRGWNLQRCAEVTTANACRILHLSLPLGNCESKEKHEF